MTRTCLYQVDQPSTTLANYPGLVMMTGIELRQEEPRSPSEWQEDGTLVFTTYQVRNRGQFRGYAKGENPGFVRRFDVGLVQ